MSRQSLVKTKGFLIAIELAKMKRFFVATENSMSRQSLPHVAAKSSRT